MDVREFKRILTTFADAPADLDLDKGQLLMQIRQDVITASVRQEVGDIIVTEGGEEYAAANWIINRVARLSLLAGHIQELVPQEEHFVVPSGSLLDEPNAHPNDHPDSVEDAVAAARGFLDSKPAGACSVLYLTSDAGEGKTTLIRQLAREQAAAYKKKETKWLLLPVALGGGPFLRFEDIVVGALVNRFRFQLLYYEAFLELVKMGVIVPAFDGFEEMFIESDVTGEAVSALGNLLKSLDSTGSVLIAARKAFFEYTNFATQARLLDTLESTSVGFARLGLNRWRRDQFLDYCDKRGLASGHDVYKDVSSRLGPDHPLLTRAVLVRRLVDIADRVEDTAKLLDSLGDTPQDYFAHFVNAIIRREAYEKWIDRSGDPAKPLLSLDEHHLLLASIAQEMWHNSTNTLRQDLLEVVAELFCDSSGVSVAISRQVKDRIIHHPLLTMSEPGKPLYSFDHEEFRSFFLGEAVAGLLSRGELDALGSMLRKGVLPPASADAMAKHLRWRIKDVGGTVESLARLCVRDGPASFLRENCGALIIRLLDGAKTSPVEVRGVSFPADSLGERKIQAITFRDCYFQPTELKGSHLTGCTFINCSIERLDLCHDTSLTDTCMQNTEVKSITPPGADYIVFEPQSIQALLKGIGLPAGAPEESLREPQEPERELVLAERVLRAFRRATHINEHVLRVRLGRDANDFFDNILPRLLRAGVMEEVRYLGSGKQRRFRLSAHMDSIRKSLMGCQGRFEKFVTDLSTPDHTAV